MNDGEKKVLQRVCDFFDKLNMQDHPREQQWEYLAIRSELKSALRAPPTVTNFFEQAEGRNRRTPPEQPVEPKTMKNDPVEVICEFESDVQVLKGSALNISVVAERDFYPHHFFKHHKSDAFSIRAFYVGSEMRPFGSAFDGLVVKAGSTMTIFVEAHKAFKGVRYTLYGTRVANAGRSF